MQVTGAYTDLVNTLTEATVVLAKDGVFVLGEHLAFLGEGEGTCESAALYAALTDGLDDVVDVAKTLTDAHLAWGTEAPWVLPVC